MRFRKAAPEPELEPQSVDEVRRKVGWQVETAYDLPGDEPGPVAPAEASPLPTLPELERLVAAAGPHERIEEWRWYLEYLAGFAREDGTLDDSFALLIETGFAGLLPAQTAARSDAT